LKESETNFQLYSEKMVEARKALSAANAHTISDERKPNFCCMKEIFPFHIEEEFRKILY
jgi:hypothetical protein